MRAALALFVWIAGISGVAQAQMAQADALALASDIRWLGGHCAAFRVEWDALQRFMDRSGLIDPFNPTGPLHTEIGYQDRIRDAKAEHEGASQYCDRMFGKYRASGLLIPRSQEDIRESERLRRSEPSVKNIFE